MATDLESLARSHGFSDLTAAELKLLRAAPKGQFAICGPNMNGKDPANDPAKADQWNKDREIRADLIRWLCVDRTARELVDPRGIRAFGGKIRGALDLSYATVPFGLALYHSYLTDEANLFAVEIPELDLQGTWVQSLRADAAKVTGSIRLHNGFRAAGQVCLARAEIAGDLDCILAAFHKTPASNDIAAIYADPCSRQRRCFPPKQLGRKRGTILGRPDCGRSRLRRRNIQESASTGSPRDG